MNTNKLTKEEYAVKVESLNFKISQFKEKKTQIEKDFQSKNISKSQYKKKQAEIYNENRELRKESIELSQMNPAPRKPSTMSPKAMLALSSMLSLSKRN